MSGFSFTPTPSSTGAFGALKFGNQTAAPTFGFGPTPVSSAPTFGFGNNQPSSAPAFGTTSSSVGFPFGPPTTTTASFGFGTSTTTSTAPSFSFGAPATTAAPGFAFGSQMGSSGFSLGSGFGTNTTATTTAGGSLFSGFGSSGAKIAPSTGFGFSSAAPTTTGQTGLGEFETLVAAILNPRMFGDERDNIMAKWNQLQASWGIGKGWHSPNAPPVEFKPDNPFCRFKAIGYSRLPSSKNEDGYVGFILNKPVGDVNLNQAAIADGIQKSIAGPMGLGTQQQNFSVVIEGIRAMPDDKTEITIYVQEKTTMGGTRRVPASDLVDRIQQGTIKSQLQTQCAIVDMIIKCSPSEQQLQEYLASPPRGIDNILWEQAKKDNPDPKNLIPIPLVGFVELNRRLKLQELETRQHQGRMDMIANEISELQRKHSTMTTARVDQLKRKQLELSHRTLKLICAQEVKRRLGMSLQLEEEQFGSRLEAVFRALEAPGQARGRLSEMLSRIRMSGGQYSISRTSTSESKLTFDTAVMADIKEILKDQQSGICQLVSIVKSNLEEVQNLKSQLESRKDK